MESLVKTFREMIRDKVFSKPGVIAPLQFVCIFLQCEPAAEPYREFIIHRGSHYAFPRLTESLQTQKLVFEARFNESAIYDFHDKSIQPSKNKLMGFCDCNSQVHENSARFAWHWFNDRLEIFAYCYANGRKQEKFVGVADINRYNRYEIELTDDRYIFRLDGNPPVYMERGKTCSIGIYFKLWPYFGGQAVAPHDITIDIKSVY